MVTTTLEKPKEFLFDEKEHAYFLEGKPLLGTTTVLSVIAKPALIQWAANCVVQYLKDNNPSTQSYDYINDEILEEARVAHAKKKESAGEKGTEIHAEIETIIKNAIELGGGFIYNTKSEHKQVEKFIEWAVGNNVQFLASEKRMYSEEFWFGGTADFVCMKEGKLFVGDIKTSSAIYPEHFIQASAYAHALEEMGEYKNFDGVIIVNIPKKGGLNVKENYDLKGNFECFKACLVIYKQLRSIK